MKTIYFTAWIVLAVAALLSALTGAFDAVTLVVFSLIALGLVYALALWSEFTNTGRLSNE